MKHSTVNTFLAQYQWKYPYILNGRIKNKKRDLS